MGFIQQKCDQNVPKIRAQYSINRHFQMHLAAPMCVLTYFILAGDVMMLITE